jgi:hypothetical protein
MHRNHAETPEVIMAKKKSKIAEVRKPRKLDVVAAIQAEADAMIEAAIRRIHACRDRLNRKTLHGPYGKQQMVETIYGAVGDLERNRRVTVIKCRLMKRLGADKKGFDVVRGLIEVALPDLHPAVVMNWTYAIHLAQDHHIRPWKVRGFLYVKGGINRSADLYRRELAQREQDAEYESYRPNGSRKRTGLRMPTGMTTLYD